METGLQASFGGVRPFGRSQPPWAASTPVRCGSSARTADRRDQQPPVATFGAGLAQCAGCWLPREKDYSLTQSSSTTILTHGIDWAQHALVAAARRGRFGTNLKRIREARSPRMTQLDLAIAYANGRDVTNSHIAQLETRDSVPSDDVVQRLAEVLGCEEGALREGAPVKPPRGRSAQQELFAGDLRRLDNLPPTVKQLVQAIALLDEHSARDLQSFIDPWVLGRLAGRSARFDAADRAPSPHGPDGAVSHTRRARRADPVRWRAITDRPGCPN